MVKFGRHLQFYLECEQPEESHYIVPYSEIRDTKIPLVSLPSTLSSPTNDCEDTDRLQSLLASRSLFMKEWRKALNQASQDFASSTNVAWKEIYSAISAIPQARGASLQTALTLYTPTVGITASQDLLVFLKEIHSTANINTEALRKLVKKFDKNVTNQIRNYHTYDCSRTAFDASTTPFPSSPRFNMTNSRLAKWNSHHSREEEGDESIPLCDILLPELYSAVFTIGNSTLETSIHTLRSLLEEDEDENDTVDADPTFDEKDNTNNMMRRNGHSNRIDSTNDHNGHHGNRYSSNREDLNWTRVEETIISRRADEIVWLREAIAEVEHRSTLTHRKDNSSGNYLHHIVAHRGFHDPTGRSDIRPLENSLAAFELAWSNGVSICDCDVTLTKDEKLVLAHDNDCSRLALDPSSNQSRRRVRDMTYRELIALTLRNGVRIPLLLDVLRSANAIGGTAQLIIKLKPGNTDSCTALARLFGRYPDLMERVAAVISFDLWAMHALRAELEQIPFRNTSKSPKNYEDRMSRRNSFGSINEHSYGSENSRGSSEVDRRSKVSPLVLHPANVHSTAGNDPHVSPSLPKLMLLTVADPPTHHYHLWVDVSDLSLVDGWLRGRGDTYQPDGDSIKSYHALDGVYLRFQPEMLQPDGAAELKALSEKYIVGIWGKECIDPDTFETLKFLVTECGITYYSTSLPRDFLNVEE